jgi:FkbM family methyltransferase
VRWRVAPHIGFYALLAAHRPAAICDVGSFDGQQALRCKRICPHAKVIAFEANPPNCERVRENVGRAEVVVEHLAASDQAGSAGFHSVEAEPWQSSLLDHRGDQVVATTPVEAVRLDEYLADTEGPVVLWIDVEGAAMQVLEGAAGIRESIVAIHVELETRPTSGATSQMPRPSSSACTNGGSNLSDAHPFSRSATNTTTCSSAATFFSNRAAGSRWPPRSPRRSRAVCCRAGRGPCAPSPRPF